MHRREFVKRSRSSRLRGEKKNRWEKPVKKPRCTTRHLSPPLFFSFLLSFFLLFLPEFFSLSLSFRKLSAGRLDVVQRPTRASVSSRTRRFRWSGGETWIFLLGLASHHQPQYFSPPRGGDYSRDSLSFSFSSPPRASPCVTRDDTIVWCSLQQRVFDFSSRSFNGCNRGWILAYRKGNFKRSPFRFHCRR